MEKMEHFGVKIIKQKYSLRLIREEFALINTHPSLPVFQRLINENAYTDFTGKQYRLEWCENYRKECLENFDLNMKYFNSLDKNAFNNALSKFLRKHRKFKEINNLHQYNCTSGYYIMVLDEYKQVYIGKSDNIYKRIRKHWTTMKPLDRVLFPIHAVSTSTFSIDFFRALDTTRIFVWERKIKLGVEDKLIRKFPQQYCTNRIGGDVSTGLKALVTMKNRTLN